MKTFSSPPPRRTTASRIHRILKSCPNAVEVVDLPIPFSDNLAKFSFLHSAYYANMGREREEGEICMANEPAEFKSSFSLLKKEEAPKIPILSALVD